MNRILIKEIKSENNLPCASSKFFGNPDVWDGFVWPTALSEDGLEYNLDFISQINCAEASMYDLDGIFPKTGMLYFFWDFTKRTWKGKATVYYFDGDLSKLTSFILPDDDGNRFFIEEFALIFEYNEYEENGDRWAPGNLNSHFLLGKPTNPSQMGLGDDPPEDWQMILQMDCEIGEHYISYGGDTGFLCYFVSKADFAKRDFSSAWFLLAVD